MADVTQQSILRISDEKTMELLELYEKEECLWNTTLDQYKMRDRRTEAAQRIANKLDLKHFEAKHVMMKFKNLRTSYTQELKKIAVSRSSGSPEEDQYKPRVFWFSKMDSFLRPHILRSPINAFLFDQDSLGEGPIIIKVKSEASISECSEEQEESVRMSNPEHILPDASFVHSSSEDDAPLKPKRRKKSKADDEVHSCPKQSPCRILSSMLSSPQLEAFAKHRDDPYDSFGKYIASLLRSMPPQRALELQPRIVSLVTSAAGAGEASVSQSDGNTLFF